MRLEHEFDGVGTPARVAGKIARVSRGLPWEAMLMVRPDKVWRLELWPACGEHRSDLPVSLTRTPGNDGGIGAGSAESAWGRRQERQWRRERESAQSTVSESVNKSTQPNAMRGEAEGASGQTKVSTSTQPNATWREAKGVSGQTTVSTSTQQNDMWGEAKGASEGMVSNGTEAGSTNDGRLGGSGDPEAEAKTGAVAEAVGTSGGNGGGD